MNRQEPFALTDLQQAYLIGRSDGIELGNTSCHCYAEVDMENLDGERFQAALQKLIDRHEMLRCIVLPRGAPADLFPSRSATKMEVDDLRKLKAAESAARLAAIRSRMSHQIHQSDKWPLFEFHVCLLDSKISRLHISLDLLIADGRSFEIVFRELMQLYQHPESKLPSIELSFRGLSVRACRTREDGHVSRLARILDGSRSHAACFARTAAGKKSFYDFPSYFKAPCGAHGAGSLESVEGKIGEVSFHARGYVDCRIRRSAGNLEQEPALYNQPYFVQPTSVAPAIQLHHRRFHLGEFAGSGQFHAGAFHGARPAAAGKALAGSGPSLLQRHPGDARAGAFSARRPDGDHAGSFHEPAESGRAE